MYSGDEAYGDDITSGPIDPSHDPLAEPCPDCLAEPGEECTPDCSSHWN